MEAERYFQIVIISGKFDAKTSFRPKRLVL